VYEVGGVNQNSLWIMVGILTGAAAGILGACVSVRASRVGYARAVNPATAAVTLILAIAACLTALEVDAAWGHRVWLFLVPASLVYWFASQVRTILRGGRRRGRGNREEEV
jgi:hypothetical protein